MSVIGDGLGSLQAVLPRSHGGRTVCALVTGCSLLYVLSACRGPTHTPTPDRSSGSFASPATAQEPPPAATEPGIVLLEDELHDPDRWLFVEKARNGARGAWATASFDHKRNKLDIETRDVRQFALYINRIPIDWQRLVVIGIDGVNSELRKRDQSVYHFARDEYGRWVVLEP